MDFQISYGNYRIWCIYYIVHSTFVRVRGRVWIRQPNWCHLRLSRVNKPIKYFLGIHKRLTLQKWTCHFRLGRRLTQQTFRLISWLQLIWLFGVWMCPRFGELRGAPCPELRNLGTGGIWLFGGSRLIKVVSVWRRSVWTKIIASWGTWDSYINLIFIKKSNYFYMSIIRFILWLAATNYTLHAFLLF